MARQYPFGNPYHFTAYGFLKALGRSVSGRQHEQLKSEFALIGACHVEITHMDTTYGGSLLE